MGRAPARRFAQADGDARPADRAAGSGGQSRSSARQNGAASANPAGGGCDHRPGLRADLGDVSRFPRGKQVASYLGLIPREHSSGGRQKLGAITKQGNRMLRMLLVEAAQIAVCYDPEFRREYLHRCHKKPKAVAKVAAGRAGPPCVAVFLRPPQLRLPHSCVFCKGGYLEIRPAVDGLGSQGPWYPPFENHKGWGSLQSGRDPKGGPARPAGQVSAQNPARTWGTLLVSLVRYPLAS